MARRGGLGKGLGALIPPADAVTSISATAAPHMVEIPVAEIDVNPLQPRDSFDEESMVALTASVRELGVLQPVLVRPVVEGGYELIAGERRWRAAQRAGLQTVPAVVREVDDRQSLEHAVVENLHRDDLNPLEEAAAYQQLMEDFGLSQDDVAQRVGKSRPAVANTIRLLQLPAGVQRLVRDGALSAGHARALLGTPDRSYQEQLARRTVNEGLTVRQIEDAVRQRTEDPAVPDVEAATKRQRSQAERPAGVLELEELLGELFSTTVKITVGSGRGRVSIEFATLDDLERIYRQMVGSTS